MFFKSQMWYHSSRNCKTSVPQKVITCTVSLLKSKPFCLKLQQWFTFHLPSTEYMSQEMLLGSSTEAQLIYKSVTLETPIKWLQSNQQLYMHQLPSSDISNHWSPYFHPWVACKLLLAVQHFVSPHPLG